MRTRTTIIVIAIGAVIAACGTDGSSDTTDAAAGPATTAGQTVTTAAGASGTTSGGEMTDGIHVADTDLGSILVDPDGFTLYIFTNDTDGTSTCNDACADLWPPVAGDTAISSDLDSAMFGTTTRDDGSDQLTVNGMPLYLYTPDTSPGDVTGQGFNDVWFVVDDGGSMIEAAADDAARVDYDY